MRETSEISAMRYPAMDDGTGFCVRCGAALGEGDAFCSECGNAAGDIAGCADCRTVAAEADTSNGRLMLAAMLCLLWGLISLYVGLDTLWSVDAVMETFAEMDLLDALIPYISEAELRSSIVVTAYIFLAGAAASLTAGILAGIKRQYTVAVVSCIIASVLGSLALVGIFGFLVAYMIHKSKGAFVD